MAFVDTSLLHCVGHRAVLKLSFPIINPAMKEKKKMAH
jgi:hypothetical protein